MTFLSCLLFVTLATNLYIVYRLMEIETSIKRLESNAVTQEVHIRRRY